MADLSGVIIIVLFIIILAWIFGGIICLWLASVLGFRGEGRGGWVAGIVALGPILLIVLLGFVSWWNSPVKLSQWDVVGKYEIDRSFFSCEQAEWQNKTYQIEITEDELILRDARTETVWRYPIEWSWRGRWRFENAELRHHLVRNGPTLYRQNFTYYYVFKSPHYGNVFVSRKSIFPTWFMWGLAVAFLILALWWCFRKRGWEDS